MRDDGSPCRMRIKSDLPPSDTFATMKLLFIGDSHLRRMLKMPEITSRHILARADIRLTFVIDKDHKRWPTDCELLLGAYTDVVVSLGTVHCRHPGTDWNTAAKRMAEEFDRLQRVLPDARFYFAVPPPSQSERISARIYLFGLLVKAKVGKSVIKIHPPSALYTCEQDLAPFYAAPEEMGHDVREERKLHLNEAGMELWFTRIETVVTAHSRGSC